MRQITINELNDNEMKAIKLYLEKNLEVGAINGMFWLIIPDNLIAAAQRGHEECGDFVFAVELGDDYVSFELLVRSRNNLHCSCTDYASPEQRNFLLNFFDKMVVESKVKA